MRNYLLGLTLLLGTSGPLAAQPATTTDARVEAVTVYLNRAQLTSQVAVALPVGLSEVAIGNVSPVIDPQSVQLSAADAAGVVIVAVSYERNYLRAGEKPPALTRTEDSLAGVTQRRDALRDEVEVLAQEEALLLANQKLGGTDAPVTAQRLADLADFYRRRLTEIKTRRRAAQRELEAVERLLARLTQQVAQYRTADRTGRVMATVRADRARQVSFTLTYVAYQAGWSPAYDLRVATLGDPVQLTYRARVQQQTGVSWNQARLTLSTANPAVGGSKPEFMPQYVRFYEPPTRNEVAVSEPRSLSKRVQADAAEATRAEAAAPAATAADYTTVNEGGLATEFVISLPYTIASGGPAELVDIQRYALPAAYRYATVPKRVPAAFLLARVSGWEAYSLLPGPAQVFYEGAYVGETTLDPTTTRDTLDVSLGRDGRLNVTRTRVKDYAATNFFGNRRTEQFAYASTVRNTRGVAVTVSLEDQVPISTDGDLDVKVTDTGGAVYDQPTGRLHWTLAIPPGESRTVRFRYEVKYPTGRRVVGL